MAVKRTPGVNIKASRALLEELYRHGVRDFVFCAGARNSPLLVALEMVSGAGTYSFFEERSAAFFALGRARRDSRPVAVITTSGTAAAELLPATIEAFYSGVPLILVTADRPRRLRGTGAPQAIDQTGLFAKFVSLELDLEAGEEISFVSWDRRAPLHVNICFDEPLIDAGIEAFDLSRMEGSRRTSSEPEMSPSLINKKCETVISHGGFDDAVRTLNEFLTRARRPIAIVGTLDTPEEQDTVAEFLVSLGVPVYLEATSGLREHPSLADQALRSGERILSWAMRRGLFDSVLRIGGVPTVRIWRDLDEPDSRTHVLSLAPLPFAGLGRGDMIQTDIPAFLAAMRKTSVYERPWNQEAYVEIHAKDRMGRERLESLYEAEPFAEPSLVHALSHLVPSDVLLYIGNSLPIREWDLTASFEVPRHVRANRGVNGIDGQLSTFLGLLPARGEGWALVGDLTAMYDLTAPWALGDGPARVRFVVMNNGGGKIFSRIFKRANFENRHQLEFEGWARMWGLGYQVWRRIPEHQPDHWADHLTGTYRHQLIELRPDEDATARFWDAYDAFWSES